MTDIENQIKSYDSKISLVEGKIISMTEKIKSLTITKEGKTAAQSEKIRKDQLKLLKKINILRIQMSDMKNTQLLMIINLQRQTMLETKQLVRDTSELQRNISNDPEANPYYYSRKEKDPQYSEIARKRTSMRMRGKNPGAFTSNILEQDMRSLEQDDGADPVLMLVANKMGQKKKSKSMKKRSKGKSKGRSTRGSMRRRRR